MGGVERERGRGTGTGIGVASVSVRGAVSVRGVATGVGVVGMGGGGVRGVEMDGESVVVVVIGTGIERGRGIGSGIERGSGIEIGTERGIGEIGTGIGGGAGRGMRSVGGGDRLRGMGVDSAAVNTTLNRWSGASVAGTCRCACHVLPIKCHCCSAVCRAQSAIDQRCGLSDAWPSWRWLLRESPLAA